MSGALWTLAIDFGTSTTTAVASSGGQAEFVELDGAAAMSSAVFLNSLGSLVVGAAAEEQAPIAPHRFEPAPKSRLSEPEVGLGDGRVAPAELAAAVLGRLYDTACDRRGRPPALVRLTHPARWRPSGPELAALAQAAEKLGLPNPTFVPEPIAAAGYLCAKFEIEPGQRMVVYDLGAGGFSCAVLERTAAGLHFVTAPGGLDGVGGRLMDERVVAHLGGTRLPAPTWASMIDPPNTQWRRHAHAFRAEVHRAREALSEATVADIGVPDADIDLRLTRAELEDLLRPDVAATVAELMTAMAWAKMTPLQLPVYLIGGVSRMPLVASTVQDVTGVPPRVVEAPEAAAVLGSVVSTVAAAKPGARPSTGSDARRVRPPPRAYEEFRQDIYWNDWAMQIALILAGLVIVVVLVTAVVG